VLRVQGHEDDQAHCFTGPRKEWMINGADLAAEIGPFLRLKQFAGVPVSTPKWVVVRSVCSCLDF
jgi:hypothetical protein